MTSDNLEPIGKKSSSSGARETGPDQTSSAKSSDHGAPFHENEMQDYIGRALRSLYDHVLYEEIPEPLLQLMNDLQRQRSSKP